MMTCAGGTVPPLLSRPGCPQGCPSSLPWASPPGLATGKRDAGSPRSSLGTLRAPSLRPQPSGKDHRLGPLDQTGSTDRESFGL